MTKEILNVVAYKNMVMIALWLYRGEHHSIVAPRC